MTPYQDKSYAIYPKSGSGRSFDKNEGVDSDGRRYSDIDGLVETPNGFVKAYSSFYERCYTVSCVEMIKDGRLHYRRWNKQLTARGLVTKAKQFAAELWGE